MRVSGWGKVLAAGWAVGLMACSPALNWRDVRPAAAPVVALFPCKPTVEQRKTQLPSGLHVNVTVHACEADGAMYGLALTQASDDAQAPALAEALLAAQVQNFRASAAQAQAAPRRWVLRDARMPDGRPVQHHSALWVAGSWVAQAIVMGPQVPRDAVDTFVDGVKLTP